MLLTDVQVLTLYHGYMTTSRRSSPVPQLKCVGGTAGCTAFVPKVVQCYNRGSDGTSIQWECKTDMTSVYKFGRIEVTCEGYERKNDPHILKGSCGLMYRIDFTKEPSSWLDVIIAIIIILIIVAFVFWLCYMFDDNKRSSSSSSSWYWFGNWGSGDGGSSVLRAASGFGGSSTR